MKDERIINSGTDTVNGEYRFTKKQLNSDQETETKKIGEADGTYSFSKQQLNTRNRVKEESGKPYSLIDGILTVFGTSKCASGIKYRALPQAEPVTEVEILILQDGIERIEDWAFANYPNLKKIVFPSTLKSIGDSSFYMCNSLQELRLPNSVEEIGFCAFQECNSLRRVKLPAQLRVLHGSAFYKDASLREIIIPERITTIENGLFQDCISLETVEIPEGVTKIESFAFAGSGVKQLYLPSTLSTVGDNAFSGSTLEFLAVKNSNLKLGWAQGITDRVEVIGGASTRTVSNKKEERTVSSEAWTQSVSGDPGRGQSDFRNAHKADFTSRGKGLPCPRCRSTNTTQTRRHKLFSFVKALFMILFPPLILFGFIGSTRTECSCQSCGQTWTQRPGKFSIKTLGEWFMYL